jgi:hypothetical protein
MSIPLALVIPAWYRSLIMTNTTKQTLANLKKTQTVRSIDRGAWKAIAFSAKIANVITAALEGDLAAELAHAAEVTL